MSNYIKMARTLTLTCFGFATAAQANRIALPRTPFTIDLPPEFAPMPEMVKNLKYSRGGNPPSLVYSTPGPRYAVNIAVSVRPAQGVPKDAQSMVNEMKNGFQHYPGAQWVAGSVKKQAGYDWAISQFWIQGLDTQIYNEIRDTVYGDKIILVTVNATKALYPSYAAQLEKALDSIR